MNFPADPPPEGRLIEEAREVCGLSQNEAAARSDMSGTRWRQIVKGDAGPLTSPRGVATLARMASVVRVTPERLEHAGRDDVARALRRLAPDYEPTRRPPADPTDDELDEMITAARKERERGNPELYELLMSVWRLRHPETRETTHSDATRDQTGETA